MEKAAKRVHHDEHCEIVPSNDLMIGELKQKFEKTLWRDALTRQTIEETGATAMEEYDKVFVCKMCKNYFTINRSYGKHDCFAHYGYKDFSKPGSPVWSCCGNGMSSLGCMKCDHLPNITDGVYSNSSPTMEVSLCTGLYGMTLPFGKTFFLKRYLKDPELCNIMRRNGRFLRLKMVFLDEKTFRMISKSGSIFSKIKSQYVPYNIKTKKYKGKKGITKERVYINMNRSKFIVPLSRPSSLLK